MKGLVNNYITLDDCEVYMGPKPSSENSYVYLITKPGYRILWHGSDYEIVRKEKVMTKFKVGDKVRMKHDGREYTIVRATVENGRDTYTISLLPGGPGGFHFWHNDELELIKENDMSKYNVNDILVDEDGDYRKVLGVGNFGLELTTYYDTREEAEQDNKFRCYVSFDDLGDDGLRLDDGIKEVTLDDIANKFGVDVKNIRVKE